MDDKELDALEDMVPLLVPEAFQRAYTEALKSGLSVIICAGGKLVEVFPNGDRKVVKEL